MDHNKLQSTLGSQYSFNVHGVIDHHEEESAVPPETSPEPRIVEKAGSCTSLVVRYCQPTWDAISDTSLASGAGHAQGESALNDTAFTRGWDAQLAKLALASVLIDTANLNAPGKVHEADRQATTYLEAKIQMSAKDAKTWDRDEYYREIDKSKRNIEHLTLDEIFIKDYKEWTENGKKLGTSSVVKPLAFLVHKSTEEDASRPLEKALSNFMADRDLSMFGIMTAYTSEKGDFQRELLLQALEPTYADRFSQGARSEIQLERMELDINRRTNPSSQQPWLDFWTQHDLTKSRKQVAPMLRGVLKESGDET